MFSQDELPSINEAIQDFHRARSQAVLKELLARLTGETTQLLSYDEVRQKLILQGSSEAGLQDIPLASIVGSVGRYTDFTRDFLPRASTSEERWARVKVLASGMAGLPPIDVYQIGEVFFVKDGNHRVSVARQLGATHIQAYVTLVRTRVPLAPDDRLDDLILKAEYSDFLEKTQLDNLRPDADLSVTVPGQYPLLLEHIEVHRFFMGIDFQRDISYPEAVSHWYDTVYLPVIQIIRDQAIMHYFPDRTETDLYLWITGHRTEMEEQLGWQIRTEYAAEDFVDQSGQDGRGWLTRLSGKIWELVVPEKLGPGPPAGQWRLRLAERRQDCLFPEILVPLNGSEEGWYAFEQALVLALRERSRLHGLHVVADAESLSSESALQTQAEFSRRCGGAGIDGQLVVASGGIVDQICRNAAVNDLVVVNLAHPPEPQPVSKLSSGFSDLIRRCPRPILATPGTVSPLSRALLSYDGSPKAREALFVAAYIAGEWKLPLVVVVVADGGLVTQSTLDEAREYLEARGIQAEYELEKGSVAEAVKWVSAEKACDMILIGGYGSNPVLEVVLGSQVDHVLRESFKPVFICR